MIWNSAGEFFAMGGYGLYVWGSYGAVAAWMILEPIRVSRMHSLAMTSVRETENGGDQ